MERKVVLVTGSTRGIGRATLIEFAKNNYDVVINYVKSEEEAKELYEFIKDNYNVNVLSIKCDISVEGEVISMIDKIITNFGKIDVLVNNAGISMDNHFYNKNVDEFKKVIDVNLIGTFLVSKYVSKYMLENKSGRIINITSTNGIDTYYPNSMDYDASKAGVISLTHNLSKELSPYITVNGVACGWVNTDATSDMDDSFEINEINNIYLKRFGEKEEVAKVVYFLSTDAASYINNEIIRVDGGVNHG